MKERLALLWATGEEVVSTRGGGRAVGCPFSARRCMDAPISTGDGAAVNHTGERERMMVEEKPGTTDGHGWEKEP